MYESGSNMESFKKISSIVTPLDRLNVDTDQIVPKQFLKLVQRTGFGKFLFYNWRFDADGKPKKDFVLNNSCTILESSVIGSIPFLKQLL